MKFADLIRMVEKWERLPNGCVRWRGTVNQDDVPVIKIDGRLRSVRAVLKEILYGEIVPEARPCDTPGCLHPRHDRRLRRKPVAV